MSEPSLHERIPVKSHAYGMRLLDFLEQHWPDVHRAYFRRLVLAELVKVNRIIGTPYTTLRRGDIIDIARPPGDPPPRPRVRAAGRETTQILHADDQLLVIDKPVGDTSEDVLASLGEEGSSDCRPVVRVEAAGSGLTVLARTADALRLLAQAFASGRLWVESLGLVEGRIGREVMTIERPLGPDRKRPGLVRACAADAKRARPARTEITVVEAFERHTLVQVIPRTDRGHQIRAHLAAMHHPIVGDEQYGAKPALLVSQFKRHYKPRIGVQERPIVQRLCLHATRLVWEREGGDLTVDSAMPKDIAGALVRLRRYAAR